MPERFESPVEENSKEFNQSEKTDIWSPTEYIKKTAFKDKVIAEEAIEESLTRLSIPLKEVTYQESDSVDINLDEVKFNFSYLPIDEQSKSNIDQYVHRKSTGLEGKSYEPFITNLDNWKRLNSLTFKVGQREKDVFDSLPKNSKIFFCPTIEDFHGAMRAHYNSSTKEKEYLIYIIGDITCPRSIATLMHEMGHVFEYENRKRGKGSSLKGGPGDVHYENAEQIRKERTASAFAFKVMKPFLKDRELKEDMINYLKGYALSAYNWEARENFEKDEGLKPYREKEAARAMFDWEVDQRESETQSLMSDFLRWQRTDAYQQWKSREENEKLHEYDEFGVWRSWIKETNYEYKKDFEK